MPPPTQQMLVSINYLIVVVAWVLSFRLFRLSPTYKFAAKFMLFFGAAALFGGFDHSIELYGEDEMRHAILWINERLPPLYESISADQVMIKLWFVTMIAIGFAEYFFMYLFLEPIMVGRLIFIRYWLQFLLGFFSLAMIVISQYFLIVAFHILSHIVVMILAFYLIIKYRAPVFLYLLLFLAYNLGAGVLQQLMMHGIVPTGPLHYNDWYHFNIIIILLSLYLLITKGKLIETIRAAIASRPK